MKKIIFFVALFNCFLIYSQNIKSIAEYKTEADSLIQISITEFDLNKNKIKETFYNGKRNRIITTKFIGNKKTDETNCDYFIKEDTCVLRFFKKFTIDNINGTERETCYEDDSLVRFIREKKTKERVEIVKTYSWELDPIKNPDFKNAIILTETAKHDRKGRVLERIHNSQNLNKPWKETYKYSKKGYAYKLIGTENDTTIKYNYNKHQRFVNRKNIKYTFDSSNKFKYIFEYY